MTLTIGEMLKELQEALDAGASKDTPCFNATFFEHNKYDIKTVVLRPVGDSYELLFSTDDEKRWESRIKAIEEENEDKAKKEANEAKTFVVQKHMVDKD